jgi:hypothetical protein
MPHWFNVSDMKIDHGSRQTYMTEPLLYIQKALAILKHMACGTMAERVNRDGMVEAGFRQGILHDDTDISRLDGLGNHSLAMRLEYEVVTGKPSLEALQHFELLFRNGYDTILFAFALIDEDLLPLKTDIMPFEAASLAYS